MDRWRAENRFPAFIDYAAVEGWRNFGGIRIEEDFAINETGSRLLGKPIPKTVDAVEALATANPDLTANTQSRIDKIDG